MYPQRNNLGEKKPSHSCNYQMCPFHRKWTTWFGSWTVSRCIPLNDNTATRAHTHKLSLKYPLDLDDSKSPWLGHSILPDPQTHTVVWQTWLEDSPQTSHAVYVQNRHWWPITDSNGDNKGKRRLCERSKMNSKETWRRGFISRRPKEKLKITAVETACKTAPTWSGRKKQAIKCMQGFQLWL